MERTASEGSGSLPPVARCLIRAASWISFAFCLRCVPDLFDSGNDHLQSLQSLDRFLVETENEQLAPVADFSRIPLDLDENILSGLRGEIH